MRDQARPLQKILIANRGEISLRIQRACAKLGIEAVAVYTIVDATAPFVLQAPHAVLLGDAPGSYLDGAKLLEVAIEQGCQAIAPGYGFLSENAAFAEQVEAAGLEFLGPTADTMRMFAEKHTARALAEQAHVPVLPGSELLRGEEHAVQEAHRVGLPVLLKATGGGGGIGIYRCSSEDDVRHHYRSAARQGQAAFGNAGVFVEKYVERARHIEVQIFGDGTGNVVAFPERECSIQRRHQKVVEESPSPFVSAFAQAGLRELLQDAAKRLGQLCKYRSAGTVEYVVDDSTGEFYFLEVNTRLQVEHGITEMVAGVDLVAWQLELQGALSSCHLPAEGLAAFQPTINGHAIEARICAEDPAHSYRPCTGLLDHVDFGDPSARVDTWIAAGVEVSAFYDSLLAKLMVHGSTRTDAISRMTHALGVTEIKGVVTNLQYLRQIVADPRFSAGDTTTGFLQHVHYAPHAIEVLQPGMMTTVQDYPGRIAYWSVGVPPSGPMDAASHRVANALVGNDDAAAALEVTLSGPTLRFFSDHVVAVCGAQLDVLVDDEPVRMFASVPVKAGQVLRVGKIGHAGSRAYIAVSGGGVDVSEYLGSKSTFVGGGFGGHQGRALRAGDMLPIHSGSTYVRAVSVPPAWCPAIDGHHWNVHVLPGPQTDPDYFTTQDIEVLLSAEYKVHHNSNRLGIRLQGPKPQFARTDGHEGGSHPSNVHDQVYAIGTINFTGDTPVVLMVDGPSLGGFVCPLTVISADLWKMGQARPGDTIRFVLTTLEHAHQQRAGLDVHVELLRRAARGLLPATDMEEQEAAQPQAHVVPFPETRALLHTIPASDTHPGAQYRLAGDRYLFVEYGPMKIDLALRIRVDALQQRFASLDGLVEISPGVRSALVEYDPSKLPLASLLEALCDAESIIEPILPTTKIPNRIVRLPMAFDDDTCRAAVARYMATIRKEAPYLPSNIQYIAANNGLEDEQGLVEAVRKVAFSASYMVLGLGDVFLGAPCAVPVDPRHRLVVQKYNPARTFTPEGAVGLGGAFLCIYGMDSPGGYQLIGRTLPIWSSFPSVQPAFSEGRPWLLRNLDEIRFYEVTSAQVEQLRLEFRRGKPGGISINPSMFSMGDYLQLVESVQPQVAEFKQRQAEGAAKTMAVEQAAKDADIEEPSENKEQDDSEFWDKGWTPLTAAVSGTVVDIRTKPGACVSAGDTLVVLEAMKMEYEVTAERSGVIEQIVVAQGEVAAQGTALAWLS